MWPRLCYVGFGISIMCLAASAFALSSSGDKARVGRASTSTTTVRRAEPVEPVEAFGPRDVSSQSSRPSTIIVIDAGHGGFDRGGIPSQRIAEKDMPLDVALRLRKKLLAAGYRVVMTRDSDVFIPLPGRVAIANSNRNAIFICVHFNSATRTEAN